MYNKALFYIPSYISVYIHFTTVFRPHRFVFRRKKAECQWVDYTCKSIRRIYFFSVWKIWKRINWNSIIYTASWYWGFQEVKVEPATASLILQKLHDCDGYSYRNDAAAEFHIRLADGVENARSSVWIYNCKEMNSTSFTWFIYTAAAFFYFSEPRIQKLYTINSKMNHCCCITLRAWIFKQNQSIRVILDWCLYQKQCHHWIDIKLRANSRYEKRTSFNLCWLVE